MADGDIAAAVRRRGDEHVLSVFGGGVAIHHDGSLGAQT